jgi:hypothetical protein
MKKIFIYWLLIVFLFSCKEKEKPAVVMKTLSYPSASAVEYVNGKLYIMGDDATQMLVLDTNFSVIDSIQLFDYPSNRIPKKVKHDIESILYLKESNQLMLLGSGSLSPYRDTTWNISIDKREKNKKSINFFFETIKKLGVNEVNIEAAVKVKDQYILANRGHLGSPKNHLVFTPAISNDMPIVVAILPVNHVTDLFSFQGISGLTYSLLNDALIMTVSTEQTASVLEDGAIGKSYIWIIKDISARDNLNEVEPSTIIDLEQIDSSFKGYKIESATVIDESSERIRLVLVADNDDGNSTVFKLSIKAS